MKHARKAKRGFTLIEILIVVVILGILAAIVIPQFTNASQDALVSRARSQLQSMRSQVELHRVQNGGDLPGDGTADVAAMWNDLINGGLIRAAPEPGGDFAWVWDGTDLTLTFGGATIPDVDGDGDGDADDVTAIEAW